MLRAIVAVLAIVWASSSMAGEGDLGQECLDGLRNPDVEIISCSITITLVPGELRDLQAAMPELFPDASCFIQIALDRQRLLGSLLFTEIVTIPEQPVSCQIVTPDEVLSAQFTLAPQVILANGKAISATLGLGNISGLHPLIAVLVAEWINTDAAVEEALVDAINDFIENRKS